ncbi:hypothetical protein HPP92_018889 [Vanilla planifolia]|uniref:Uncharacterized protein n=1 Tax=Vanilla planifolia TaxID=51239 RepID=A0A835QCX1_VANPL|nr:hypothetical protein HPP92_018889 [Vanilla planifolia]
MDASDLHHKLTKQRRLNGSTCIKSDGFQGWLGGRFGRRAVEKFHYNARKMGRKEKAGDAANPLDFADPRSLVELKRAKADATKNIDSISSPKPESKKCLKEAELPGYDVSVSFEGPKTLSVLKQKKGAGPQNGEILVASNNRKEENEAKALNHANRDRITHGQHVIGDEIEAAAKDDESWYSNPTVGGCEAETGVDYKRKYDITGCMDVDPDEHNEEDDFAKRIDLIYS